MSETILKKKIIDKLWNLSKESFQNDDVLSKLRELEREIISKLSNLIIVYIDNYNLDNNLREYYSFYRIYSLKGKYLFSLPARLNLPVSEWKYIDEIITRYPNDPTRSNNGGDYYSGYRIWRLSHPKVPNEIYKIAYNRMLNSDFQEQGWEEPELCFSIKEIVEITGEDINLKQL